MTIQAELVFCRAITLIWYVCVGGNLLEPSSDVSLLQLFLAVCIASLPRLPFISTVGSTSLLTREGQRCFSQSVMKGEKKPKSLWKLREGSKSSLYIVNV